MKVLLSIKPEYVSRILNGTKKFEFRRRLYKNEQIDTVVIYATKPVGRVVGEFSIKQVHSEHPKLLWDKTKEFSGIAQELYNEYFSGREVGHAIEIDSVKKYRRPKKIEMVLPSGVAPQSFAYLR